jgi:hypothetical protein
MGRSPCVQGLTSRRRALACSCPGASAAARAAPIEAGRDVDCATARIPIVAVTPGATASKASLADVRCLPPPCTTGPLVLTPWVLPPSTRVRTPLR